jgi:hypothetical protein
MAQKKGVTVMGKMKISVYLLAVLVLSVAVWAAKGASASVNASLKVDDTNLEASLGELKEMAGSMPLPLPAADEFSEITGSQELSAFCEEKGFSTQLYTELYESGREDGNPDNFIFTVKVTNVGVKPALLTAVSLPDVPADWTVSPKKTRYIPLIKPGQTKWLVYSIHKGSTDETITAIADAANTAPATSEAIPIPIAWATVGATTACMSIMGFALSRRH